MWIYILLGVLLAAAIGVLVAVLQSRHEFACCNCGNHFHAKWTQLIFEVHAMEDHRLQCPRCGIKGTCQDLGVKK